MGEVLAAIGIGLGATLSGVAAVIAAWKSRANQKTLRRVEHRMDEVEAAEAETAATLTTIKLALGIPTQEKRPHPYTGDTGC